MLLVLKANISEIKGQGSKLTADDSMPDKVHTLLSSKFACLMYSMEESTAVSSSSLVSGSPVVICIRPIGSCYGKWCTFSLLNDTYCWLGLNRCTSYNFWPDAGAAWWHDIPWSSSKCCCWGSYQFPFQFQTKGIILFDLTFFHVWIYLYVQIVTSIHKNEPIAALVARLAPQGMQISTAHWSQISVLVSSITTSSQKSSNNL